MKVCSRGVIRKDGVSHEPGTPVDLDDAQAKRLLEEGKAFKPGEDPHAPKVAEPKGAPPQAKGDAEPKGKGK